MEPISIYIIRKLNKNNSDAKPCPIKGHATVHHLPLKEDNSIISTPHNVSSSVSAVETRGTKSLSINSGSTKSKTSNYAKLNLPAQNPIPRPFPPRNAHFYGDRYNKSWDTLSAYYSPKQHEYDQAITSMTHGKKPKRKNIFQLGRPGKNISSSQMALGGSRSSSSSCENTPVIDNAPAYRSLLLSSSYANIRKEPRPSSAHGHLSSSGHHHGVGKIRHRHTHSGTESGGSSGSSTREYGGRGRGITDNEEVIFIIILIMNNEQNICRNDSKFVSLHHNKLQFNYRKRYAMRLRWLYILMQSRKNNAVAITIIITTDTNIEADVKVPGQMEKNRPLTTEDINDIIDEKSPVYDFGNIFEEH